VLAVSSYNCVILQRSCLLLLAAVLGYAVYQNGGAGTDWNICLLALGVTAAAYWLRARAKPVPAPTPWLLLFPCFVALQLLPLPLFLLRLLSPTRAAIVDSLARLMPPAGFAPLATAPAITVTYLPRIAAYVLVFVLARDVSRRMSGPSRWLAAIPLIAIAAAEAALGVLQNARAEEVQGTYVNKNHFAGLLEMMLPFAAAYSAALFARRSYTKALGMLSIALIILAGLVCSLSKMGFAAGLAGLFVMGALAVAGKVRGGKKWLVIAGMASLVLFVFIFLPSDAFIANYGGVASKGQTAALEGRWPIWRETMHLIAAYPLFGCGLGNYETAFLRYQASGVDRVFTYAHNDYLQIAAELGLVGFVIAAVLWLPAVSRPFRAAWQAKGRTTRFLGLGCAGAIAAIGLHSLTDFNMYVPANAMTLAWICGIGASLPLAFEKPVEDRHAAFFRRFAIGLAFLPIVYAPVRMVFDSQFRSDARAEGLFCRFGICDTDAVMTAETLAYGGQAAAVPLASQFKALRRDPNRPARWCDAGDAMLRAGRNADAAYCYDRALLLGPHIPTVLMQAADFYGAVHETSRAMPLMSRVLADTDTYDGFVFAWYAKNKVPVAEVLAYGLPPDQPYRLRAAEAYMRNLIELDRPSTDEVWSFVTAHGLFSDGLAREYAQHLYDQRDYEAAARAWAESLGPQSVYLHSNYIFNGDFERAIADSPFDWRINPRDGVEVGIDAQSAHTGSHALRIQFDGKQNLDYSDVGQTAFVKPGRYRFEAYIRTQGITTDKGVGIHIYDRNAHGRLDVRTEELAGTHDWTKVERVLVVPGDISLLAIEVSRQHSMKFDNQINGTVWIDSVRLVPVLFPLDRGGGFVSQVVEHPAHAGNPK